LLNTKLKLKRKDLKLTQAYVAKNLNMAKSTYNYKEKGRSEFNQHEIIGLMRIFDCKFEDLFEDEIEDDLKELNQ
jgi:DNA-binding XRE family transcriptional regulator